MNPGRRDIAAALALIAASLGYGALIAGLPDRTLPNTPGPSFFPWLIAALLLLLSLALLLKGALAIRRGQGERPPSPIGMRPVAALVCFAVYLSVLPRLGFLWISIPFFAVLVALYGGRGWAIPGAASVAVPVALYFLFRDVFRIFLP